MKKHRFTKGLLALLAIACFLFVGRKYLGHLDLITQAHWAGIVAMACVHLLTLLLQGLTIKWGLDPFGRSINEGESFVLFVISSYANLLVPRSGVGTTALYLKRICKTSMVDYSSIVLFNGALFVIACSSIGCLFFGIDWIVNHQVPNPWIVGGLPSALALSCLAISIKWNLPKWYQGPGRSVVARLNHATSRLYCSGNLLRMGLTHWVLVFLRALRLYLAFWALGIEAAFSVVLLVSVLGDLAFVIAVTPGALGFREAAIAMAASQLGITVPMALSVALFDRLVFSLTVVVTAQLLIAFVIRRDFPNRTESSPAS